MRSQKNFCPLTNDMNDVSLRNRRVTHDCPIIHRMENAEYTFRVDHLRQTGALIKFLSLEPLLGPLPDLDLEGIDWVIVGGESGPGARSMDLSWVRAIRDRCQDAGVSFFLKQLGGVRDKRGKEKTLLDGKLWREMPAE